MFEGMKPPTKERLCIIGVKSASLSKEDLAILNAALENPAWSSNALSNELSKRGFVAGRNAVNEHRKKVCVCYRT